MHLQATSPAAPPEGARVLVVSQSERAAADVCGRIAALGCLTQSCTDPARAVDVLRQGAFDVCVIEESTGVSTVLDLQNAGATTQFVQFKEHAQEDVVTIPMFHADVVQTDGAPGRLSAALDSATRLARKAAENARLKRMLSLRTRELLVGNSPAVAKLREQIQSAADGTDGVLVTGEPGVGTNVVAQMLHLIGPRSHRPYVRVDGRVHTVESFERELYGEPPAAGPAGTNVVAGRIEHADGGTLLIDNLDDVPVPAQARLARALKNGCFTHPGANQPININVRLVAATHADPRSKTGKDCFDPELLELTESYVIEPPRLRDRPGDVSLLCEHFLQEQSVREGLPPRRMAIDALRLLEQSEWRGNVRELRNVLERACTADRGPKLTAEMVGPWLLTVREDEQHESLYMSLRDMERKLIEAAFSRCAGNREQTAGLLKIGLRTLSGKLREYGYPPRGGPGSNIAAVKSADKADKHQADVASTQQRQAA